ncbi:MAG: hypothetical protein RBR78_01145 [Flavobacteriaceae bacterium]|jgi:hypothetical protein|nr:hypothetical protein [Flavobacteriaceae bacterium]
MKSIVISFLVMFQIADLINEPKYNKKLLGCWEMKYVSLGYEKTGNGTYKTSTTGTIGTTTFIISDDKTAVLNYPNKESYSFEWNTKKKTITLIPIEENNKDEWFDGAYTYKFKGKNELSLKNDKMTIYLTKEK